MSTEGFRVEVIADSVSPTGTRLTTLQLKYPRFIHSEFMTHRVFSRNASSSRAVPVAKELERVRNNPAMPVHWGKNQPGMQAKEECFEPIEFDWLCGKAKASDREDAWREAADRAADIAERMSKAGYHKQIVNRLLEPFQWIDVVVTATEWENFFNLRDHEDAQPEIKVLAQKMREALVSSTPKKLSPGEWHLPYITDEDREAAQRLNGFLTNSAFLLDISAARCARVSYRNHDGSKCTLAKDSGLALDLKAARHMSPFEHQGTPILEPWQPGFTHQDRGGEMWSGNFRGFVQYRQLI